MNPAPSYLTLEERERWEYANGNVEVAALCAQAIDQIEASYTDGMADGCADEAARQKGAGDA